MSANFKNRRVNKGFLVYPFILIIGCLSCTSKNEDYNGKIPDFDTYIYHSIDDWAEISEETLTINELYNSKTDSNGLIVRSGYMKQFDKNSLWVADPLMGRIIEIGINEKVGNQRVVVENGKGPQEVIRPSSMFFSVEKDSLAYILDSGQACMLVLNSKSKEIDRVCSANLPISTVSVYMDVLTDNSYIWPTQNHEEYTLIEWNSFGEFKKGLVKRIIPMGYQPITYNDVVYAIGNKREDLVFAYKGLPLVFLELNRTKNVINLLPNQKIKDFNVPLEKKPENESGGVKNIVRDMFLVHGKLLVSLETELYVIDLSGKEETRKVSFKNLEGDKINFHKFSANEDWVFILDGYRNIIYSVETNSIVN